MSSSSNVRAVRQKGGRQSFDLAGSQRKTPASFIHQLPYTSLPKHVLWLSLPQQLDYGSVSLTLELEYFAEYVKLDEKEEWCRSYLLEDLDHAIKEEFPRAQVNAFGSFPVGLSTYASDLDVTVMFCGHDKSLLNDSSLARPHSTTLCTSTTERDPISGSPDSSLLEKRTHESEPAPDKRHKSFHHHNTTTTNTTNTANITTQDTDMYNPSSAGSESNNESVSVSVSSYDREEARVQNIFNLQAVHATLQEYQWVHSIDLRHRARVPIINFLHSSGVECDISADLPHHSTVAVVHALIQTSGPALYVLSAFLKIYLGQLGLDAPYTGGLGSYKLYILLAKHIELNPKLVANCECIEYGVLLMSFLKYYGMKQHLNSNTVVQVGSAEEASFERTSKIVDIQRAFETAHSVLVKCAVKAANPSISNSNRKYVGREPASCSTLAGLLNAEVLCRERMRRRALCHQFYNNRTALTTNTTGTSSHNSAGITSHTTYSTSDETTTNYNASLSQGSIVSDSMYGNHIYLDDSNSSYNSTNSTYNTYNTSTNATTNTTTITTDSSADTTNKTASTNANHTIDTTNGTLSTSASSDELQLLTLKSRLLQKRLSSRQLSMEGGDSGAASGSGIESTSKHHFVASIIKCTDTSAAQTANTHTSTTAKNTNTNNTYANNTNTHTNTTTNTPTTTPTTDPRLLFNPHDTTGKSIISGQYPLPTHMVVRDEHKMFLPDDLQRRLGPFRNLQLGERYTDKSEEELVVMQSEQQRRVEVLREQVYGGSGGSIHSNGTSSSGAGTTNTANCTNNTYSTTTNTTNITSTNVRIPLIFSPLNPYCKLITEGALPLPPTMKISLKQQLLLDEAKHCREGLDVLIRQRQRRGNTSSTSSTSSGGSCGGSGSSGSGGSSGNADLQHKLLWDPDSSHAPHTTPRPPQQGVSSVSEALSEVCNTNLSPDDDVCSIESYSDWELTDLPGEEIENQGVSQEGFEHATMSNVPTSITTSHTDDTATTSTEANNTSTNTNTNTKTATTTTTTLPLPISRASSTSDMSVECGVEWVIDRKPTVGTSAPANNYTSGDNAATVDNTHTTEEHVSTGTASDSDHSLPPPDNTLPLHAPTSVTLPTTSTVPPTLTKLLTLPTPHKLPTLPTPPLPLLTEVPAQLRGLVPLSWGKVQLIREVGGKGRVVDIKSEFPAVDDAVNTSVSTGKSYYNLAVHSSNTITDAGSIRVNDSADSSRKPQAAHRPAPEPSFTQNTTLGHRTNTASTNTGRGGDLARSLLQASAQALTKPISRKSNTNMNNTGNGSVSSGVSNGVNSVGMHCDRDSSSTRHHSTFPYSRPAGGSWPGGTGNSVVHHHATTIVMHNITSVEVQSGVQQGSAFLPPPLYQPQHPALSVQHSTQQSTDYYTPYDTSYHAEHDTQHYPPLPQMQFLTQQEHSLQYGYGVSTNPHNDHTQSYHNNDTTPFEHITHNTSSVRHESVNGGMYYTTSAAPPPHPAEPPLPYYETYNTTTYPDNSTYDTINSTHPQYTPAPLPPPPLNVPPPPSTPYTQPAEPYLPPPPLQDYYSNTTVDNMYSTTNNAAQNTPYDAAYQPTTYTHYTPHSDPNGANTVPLFTTQYMEQYSPQDVPTFHHTDNGYAYNTNYTGYGNSANGASSVQVMQVLPAPVPAPAPGPAQAPGPYPVWQPNVWY